MINYSSDRTLNFSVSNSKHYLLLFILWPFMAFITALSNYRQKEAKKVVYFFLIYYGLTFVNTNEFVDAFRYGLRLKANATLSFSEFFNVVGGLYSDTTVDIIEPLVSFVVSRFTDNSSVYFAIWTAIFGFFYLKSIDLLYNRHQISPGWNTLIIMLFFIFILPITSISGVRMPTATWIFFYGACHVILYRDYRYLILTLSSALVHWSFITANVILIVYVIAGNRNFIYLPLAILSTIIPQLLAPAFRAISLRLGGVIQSRYEGYSSEGYIIGMQESHENASWFLQISDNLVYYYLIAAIAVIQLRNRVLSSDREERNLFSFLLLFFAFVNFGKAIPTFGGRFQIVFYLFATLYLFLYALKIPGEKVNILTLIGIFPMFLFAAIKFRLGSESINAWIFTPLFGSPVVAPLLSISEMLF